jgi:DNA-binding transcriptional LysR family regulator
MSELDYLDLNGRALQLFVTVYEEGSVTKAADRLNISQSAVSHMLDKLRLIIGDPLFVRSGRGIIATSQATVLFGKIQPVLSALQELPNVPDFHPEDLTGILSIGAGAIQRDILLPPLAKILRQKAPSLDLKVINSGVTGGDLLRKERCDLLISPTAPDGADFMQKKLLEDHWCCFYNPSTKPPSTMDQYLARPHAKVVFSHNERSAIDSELDGMGKTRRIALLVESFSALSSLMQGTDLIIALPKLTGQTVMRGFASCPLPFTLEPLQFQMIWHLSKHNAPYHRWVRSELVKIASEFKP